MSDVTIVIKGDDRASGAISAASKSLEDLDAKGKGAAGSTKDVGGSLDVTGASAGKMSPQMIAAGAAVAGVTVAAVAAAAAIAGLVSGAMAAIDAFREQDEVNRQLEQSLRNAGFAGEPLREAIEGIDESIGKLAKSTMFGDEELKGMAASFLMISGEAEVTQDQLSQMTDIAAGMGVSTKKASEIMAQAMKGDLPRGLEKTTALTKDQVQAINELEDPAERAAAAQQILADSFAGAAENINPLFRAIKNLEDAQGDLMQKAGELIAETGAAEPVLDAITDALNRVEAYLDDNKEAIQEYVIEGVALAIDAVTSFIERLQMFSPVLAAVVTALRVAVNQWKNLYEGIRLVGDAMVVLQSQVIGRLLGAMSSLLGAVGKVVGIVNKDLGAAMDEASKKAAEFSDIALEVSENAFVRVGERAEKIQGNVGNIVDTIKEWPDVNTKINDGLGKAASFTQDIADRTREAKDRLGELRDEADAVGSRAIDVDDDAGQRAGDDKEAERLRKIQEEEEKRNAIATARLAILREQDPFQRATLEMTARELELSQRELTEQERLFEQEKIRAEFDRATAAAHADSHAAKMAALQEEEEAQQKILDIERDRIDATMASNEAMLGGLGNILPGLDSLAVGLANIRDLEWDTREATDAMVSAMSGLAQVGGQVSSLIAEDKKQAAKIEVGFQAAAAIGSFAAWAASGFTAVPLGIATAQHTLAAAKFAQVAGGGGASSRPSASAPSAPAGSTSRDRATAQQSLEGGGGDTIINIDLGSSTNLRDATDTGREIAQVVDRSQQDEFRL